MSGKKRATTQDFIEWIEEHAIYMGYIGLGLRHDPPDIENIFGFCMPQYQEDMDAGYLEDSHLMVIERQYAAVFRRQNQAKIMDANEELCIQTELALDRRLRALGTITKRWECHWDIPNPIYRKVVELYNIEHPPAKTEGRVGVYLYLGHRYERKTVVYLPIDATLDAVYRLLKGAFISQGCRADMYPKGGAPRLHQMRFKYSLLAPDNRTVLSDSSVELLTDEDFRTLIKETSRTDIVPPIALITLVSYRVSNALPRIFMLMMNIGSYYREIRQASASTIHDDCRAHQNRQ